jgi:uridine kinase
VSPEVRGRRSEVRGRRPEGRGLRPERRRPTSDLRPLTSGPRSPVFLVAIVGGSGAGKSWLAEKLQTALGPKAARISLDDFYRDRSRVPPARRAKINFDHPRAIDWPAVERALRHLRAGRGVRLPRYDFKTHCRLRKKKILPARPIVIMDGLWLLRRPSLRRLFDHRIFIDCPTRLRWRRRLARDLRSRGRTRASVQQQFRETVEPMHIQFVAPQKELADMVLPHNFSRADVRRLARELRTRV